MLPRAAPRGMPARRALAVLLVLLVAPLALAAAPSAAPAGGPAPALEAPASNEPWARALVAALPRATAVNDADGNRLFDELDAAYREAGPLARVPVIVSFVQGVASEEGVAAVRRVAPEAPVDRAFRIVPAYAGALDLREALAVARLPEVRQVELDSPGAPELETATRFMGADAAVDGMGVTGSLDGAEENVSAKDVVIAILDTGFHAEHEDLAGGKLLHFLDVGEGKTKPYDPDGHGTHVASIAAGWGRADAANRGVAPGAGVVGIKIAGGSRSAESQAIAGYEWIVENREAYGIRVATMSFGFGRATDGTTALERAVDAAWEAGIVCFKSNGNSGPNRGTMTVPAAARGILGVGSLLDPDGGSGLLGVGPASFGFAVSSFSSRGPTTDGRVKPDLMAPGQTITAAEAGTKDGYVALSGTSMASPFAAGAAALVIAANPALAPDEVRDVLFATAEDWGVEGPDVDYGHGRIQVHEAVRLALARAGKAAPAVEAPLVPYHEVRAGVVGAGPYEGTFTVNDTEHPIAATFIGEGTLLAAEVRDASGAPVGRASLQAPSRQLLVSFQPEAPGEYAFRVVAAPGTAFVVDFSHGTAESLAHPLPAGLPVEGQEGLVPGATLDENRVPGPALVPALLAAALLLRALRRRPEA